jgi:predicted dehydrogenase
VIQTGHVDFIDIAAPNHLHRDMIIAAAEARIPFVVEKPLTRTLKEADEVMEVVKRTGTKAMYSENVRYGNNYQRLKSIIDQGGIGTPYLIQAYEMHSGPTHADWFWDADKTGGGALIDMGIHGLYAMEWLMGRKANRVYADAGVLKWHDRVKGGAEDTAIVTLRFENTGMGILVNTRVISGGLDVRIEVYGSGGNLYLGGVMRSDITAFSHRGWGRAFDEALTIEPHVMPAIGWSFQQGAKHSSHINELRHFIDCVANDKQPLSTLEEGRRGMVLVDAIYRSAKSGMPVDV